MQYLQGFTVCANTQNNNGVKLPKLKVAGPNPVSRSNNNKGLAITG